MRRNAHFTQRLFGSTATVIFVSVLAACGGGNTGADGSGGDGTLGDAMGDSGLLPDGAPIDGTLGDVTSDMPQSDGPITVSDAGMVVTDMTGTFTCYQIACRGHLLECGDCQDNDHDGYIDQHDPECLGPCGNSEGPSLFPDVGGGTSNSCMLNCYFDFGQGSGVDNCVWDHSCDPLMPQANCPYNASDIGGHFCPVPQDPRCITNCAPLTPNGCDCFGCCTFPQLAGRGPGGGPGFVYLGSVDTSGNPSCTFATITDPSHCHACTPVTSCYNACDPCEVCIGRPMPSPDCNPTPPDAGPDAAPPSDGGTSMQCPSGVQPCGLTGQAACPFGYYCITGCCEMAPG